MEINNRVKELEDELKILKAEIRNILLEIREVILDKTNPLREEHESAFIRMDLNTTARAMAAEAAGHEAVKAAAQPSAEARPSAEEGPKAPPPEREPPEVSEPPAKVKASPKGKGHSDAAEATASAQGTRAEPPYEPTPIPTMYRAGPLSGSAVGLARWVIDAMRTVGPQEWDRLVTVYRLCGALPPNLSEALAHLQQLVRSSQGEEEPAWIKVLQDLEKLALSAGGGHPSH